jgi:hypothetical protein
MTLDKFLARPTRAAWMAELLDGWLGPDGSSWSTDTIMGVRIGITSLDYEHVDLPANRHDWYYRLGRKLRLPESYRAAADAVYRDLCIERCKAELTGVRRAMFPLAWSRAWTRYAALRVGARYAWTEKAKQRNAAWCESIEECEKAA